MGPLGGLPARLRALPSILLRFDERGVPAVLPPVCTLHHARPAAPGAGGGGGGGQTHVQQCGLAALVACRGPHRGRGTQSNAMARASNHHPVPDPTTPPIMRSPPCDASTAAVSSGRCLQSREPKVDAAILPHRSPLFALYPHRASRCCETRPELRAPTNASRGLSAGPHGASPHSSHDDVIIPEDQHALDARHLGATQEDSAGLGRAHRVKAARQPGHKVGDGPINEAMVWWWWRRRRRWRRW